VSGSSHPNQKLATILRMIVDLSSNDAHPIDYAAAKAAGVTGVFVKATEGMGYTNPYFHEDVAGFQAVGVPVLGYHFASFGDVNAEVAHFKSVAGPLARVLDSETSTDANWQNAFLSALGLWPTQRCNYGSASTLPRTASLLWVADYGANPGFGDCWQFTDAGTVAGISGDVDISAWTGSTANFDSLFNIASPPVPPKPPAPPVPTEQVTATTTCWSSPGRTAARPTRSSTSPPRSVDRTRTPSSRDTRPDPACVPLRLRHRRAGGLEHGPGVRLRQGPQGRVGTARRLHQDQHPQGDAQTI